MRSVASRLMHGPPKKWGWGRGEPVPSPPSPPQEAVNGQRAGAGLQADIGRREGALKVPNYKGTVTRSFKNIKFKRPFQPVQIGLERGSLGERTSFQNLLAIRKNLSP